MKEWFYRILDELVLTLIVAGILSFAYILFAFPVEILLAVAVLAISLLIVFVVIKRRKGIVLLIRPIEIKKETNWHRLGLSKYIEPNPLLVNNSHKMRIVEQTYKITENDGQYVLRYKGTNITDQVSRFFRDGVVGDSPVDITSMNIQVINKANNFPLKWKLIKDSPYEKIIEIYFFRPLSKGEEFDIEWSCVWLGTFTRSEDYVFYPVHYYKQGVEKLIAKLVLDGAPSYVELIKIEEHKPILEPSGPQIKTEDGKTVVEFTIDNPKHIYVLQFGRTDIQ